MAQENKNYYYDRNGYNTYGVRGQASGGGGVTSFGGATGDITLGTGLAISGNQVNATGVTSLGGATGDITLGTGLAVSQGAVNVTGVSYSTTAPTADNTDGIKIVVLPSEPATRYNGWWYIIVVNSSSGQD